MSEEGEKDTSIANKETDADMKQSRDENHSTEQNNAKKFIVNELKLAPKILLPSGKNPDGSAESFGTQLPQSPASPTSPTSQGQFTYGYATNEAIPMTVFYRRASQGHSGKQRPTLQELRKGFENDKVSELVLPHKIDPRILKGVDL